MSSSSSSGASGGGGGGGTGSGGGNQGGCFVCGAKNHTAGTRCPMVSLVPVPCSICGKTGHTSVACTEPAAVASLGGVATGTPSSPGFSPSSPPLPSTQAFREYGIASSIGASEGKTPPLAENGGSTPNVEAVQKKRSRKTRRSQKRRKSRKSRKLNNRRH